MHSKLPYLASLVLLLSSRSHAQDLSSLPSCAQSPALSAIGSTGCQASDFACLCKDNSFINAALAGAEGQCSQADLQKVLAFAQQLCGSVGVSLSVSASGVEGSSSVPSPITGTYTPTPVPSPVATSTQVSPSASPSSSAVAGQASETATSKVGGTATSGASGWDPSFGLRGMMWSGVVVGWWLFGGGA